MQGKHNAGKSSAMKVSLSLNSIYQTLHLKETEGKNLVQATDSLLLPKETKNS